ncbi:hypothetical protein Tdes44962_MAKER03527 [Teratosphaeria destructans]|uniref:Uncharacterized protein n=1 Tax=Teratosphaeria destructans TaxID=418781 RepID=A0A9W7SPZ7_9PEZI|nr:hypothetical protein Tdes44962_MAKER03527 [Teratosphaeria destructans]
MYPTTTTTLLTLFLATATTPATAAAILPRTTTVSQGEQSCTAKDVLSAVTYTTYIGHPFSRSLCPIIHDALNTALGIPEQDVQSESDGVDWGDCQSHDEGSAIKLVFEYEHNHGTEINKGLKEVFSKIGFNCPDF